VIGPSLRRHVKGLAILEIKVCTPHRGPVHCMVISLMETKVEGPFSRVIRSYHLSLSVHFCFLFIIFGFRLGFVDSVNKSLIKVDKL